MGRGGGERREKTLKGLLRQCTIRFVLDVKDNLNVGLGYNPVDRLTRLPLQPSPLQFSCAIANF